MGSEQYRSSSDISSGETDQIKDGKTSRKRSYEWTFCKRGFTNAKDLGGHMNIHRKDRAKAKQTNSSNSSKFNKEYLYPTYSPLVTSESSSPSMYYPILKARRNYNMCFQFPPAAAAVVVSNASRDHYGCFNQQDQHSTRASVSSSNQEQLLGANLSLQVGSAIVEDLVKDDELDLELRLGNDH